MMHFFGRPVPLFSTHPLFHFFFCTTVVPRLTRFCRNSGFQIIANLSEIYIIVMEFILDFFLCSTKGYWQMEGSSPTTSHSTGNTIVNGFSSRSCAHSLIYFVYILLGQMAENLWHRFRFIYFDYLSSRIIKIVWVSQGRRRKWRKGQKLAGALARTNERNWKDVKGRMEVSTFNSKLIWLRAVQNWHLLWREKSQLEKSHEDVESELKWQDM